jgi:ABC-type multidrug transport system ATPase subunit
VSTGHPRRRDLAPGLALAVLVAAGAAAATRLTVDSRWRQEAAELTLRLSTTASDPAEVARRWLMPLEERLRAVPEVATVLGEVTASGAELRLPLRAGADATRLAARLHAELAAVAELPSGGAVVVEVGGRAAGAPARVWLPAGATATAHRTAALLREVPGVASVELLGAPLPEVAVELAAAPGPTAPESSAGALLAETAVEAIESALGAAARAERWREPGAAAGLPVVRRAHLPAAGGLADLAAAVAALPVRLGEVDVPLRSFGPIVLRESAPSGAAFRDGEAAIVLLVRRDAEAPLLAVERSLRRRLAAVPGARLDWDEPVAVRRLLRRCFVAWLAVSLALALVGWRAGGGAAAAALAALPAAAVAAAALGWWTTGTVVHPATLVAGALALAALLPLYLRRVLAGAGVRGLVAGGLLAAASVPLAAALAPAALATSIVEPARAFAVATSAGLAALPLLPLAPGRRRSAPSPVLRRALRDPATALLLLASIAAALAMGWGTALRPRVGASGGSAVDLVAHLPWPPETTVAEALPRAAVVERELRALAGVEETWALLSPGSAIVEARLAPAALRPERLRRLLRTARARVGTAAAVEAPALGGEAAPSGLTEAVAAAAGPRPDADVDGYRYRLLLRSADLATLEAAHVRLRDRLAALGVRDSWVEGWEPGAERLRLMPRTRTSPALVAELVRAIGRRTSPPPAVRAPGIEERLVRLFPPGAPRDAAALPQAAEVLRRPLPLAGALVVPATLFAPRREWVRSRLLREDGRFVVPVELRPPFAGRQYRLQMRRRWDRELAMLPLPAGSELLRPRLDALALRWNPELVRVAAFSACLPFLLLALGTVRLGSVGRALALLLPLLLAVLATAPLAARDGGLDELALFALLAGAAGGLAATLAWAAALPGAIGSRLYAARRRDGAAPLAAALLVALALLLPTLGADAARHPWVVPLRIGAVTAAVAPATALLLLPVLLAGVAAWRQQRSPAARAARRPAAWQPAAWHPATGHPPTYVTPPPPRLEARSLVKVYPLPRPLRQRPRGIVASVARAPLRGVRALDRVSFTLEPGIVGLLGPNGAGKTTLLRLLTGLLAPSRGAVRFSGVHVGVTNLAAYRARVGFLPQGFDAYPELTAAAFLDYWARERGLRDPATRRREVERLLAAVGLAGHAGRRVRDFSGGMRRRVGIACALLAAPAVLVVDEPTTGLDVEARRRFRDTLLALAADRIIVFSTHIASDVEAVATRLLLLEGGRLRFDGAPAALVARARGRVFEAVVDDEELLAMARRYRLTSRVRELAGVRVRAVAAAGEPLPGAAVEPSLEEAYLAELSSAPA